MHCFLPFYDCVSHLDLCLCKLLVGLVLRLDCVSLCLHVLVQLCLLLFNELGIHVNDFSQLFDLFCLFFDAVSIILRKIKVQRGHIANSLTLLVSELDLTLKLRDDSDESLDDSVGKDFILFVNHLHHIASVELEGLF